MAVLSGPLLSLDASGKFGNALVYAKWKGRNYARKYVIPANPKSALQVGVRAMLRFLATEWAGLGAVAQATWDALAEANSYSPFNAYVKENQSRWGQDQPPTQEYPAAELTSGVALSTASATGHEGYADLSATVGTNTNSWGVVFCRSSSTGFTPGRANAIAVVPGGSEDVVTWEDAGLAAGTYYYRAANCNVDGVIGAYYAEFSGVVT